jgi:peptidoglycan/LPS O-acetylase OafA/YrhL
MAAMAVLLEHWRNVLFVDFAAVPARSAAYSALYLLCSAGHQAVVIFFVLSGFLVGGSVVRSIRGKRWSWREYALQRATRLEIVLIPALGLGMFWDAVGLYSGQAPRLYAGDGFNHLVPNVANALSVGAFVGNVAFLQTIVVPPFGSNGALWSLANEWWYYVLFPIAACVVGRVYVNPSRVAACVVCFCLVCAFLGKSIVMLFPTWLLGVLVFLLPRRGRPSRQFLLVLSAAYAAVVFGFAILDHRGGQLLGWRVQPLVADSALGTLTAGFLRCLLSDRQQSTESRVTKLVRTVARFSYTLYATHTPPLILCAALIVHDERWVPTLKHLLFGVGILVLLLFYAWVVAVVTEFRTEALKRWLRQHLMGESASAAT